MLVLLNTVGGDVEAGLAIAEMLASLSKPTVSLVLGGSPIGVPIAVSTDYSFIVATGTMVIHPVRMNGTVIGAPQTHRLFQTDAGSDPWLYRGSLQCKRERLEELMLDSGHAYQRSWHDSCGASSRGRGNHRRSGRHPRRRCKTSENDLYILTKYVILDLYACRFL
ncbi:MAG: ClpP family protease [Lachnospiraceae bacterium]